MKKTAQALYIHIPFCQSRCHYCDFSTTDIWDTDLQKAYVDRLLLSLKEEKDHLEGPLTSLYLGGGTPTALSLKDLDRLMEGIMKDHSFSPKAELTIEANPASMTIEAMAQLKKMGFNRISLGVQSLVDKELALLGRRHTADQALKTIEDLASLGFENISADLMKNLPLQTPASFKRSLEGLLATAISHLSVYDLTIGDNPTIRAWYAGHKKRLASEEGEEEMDGLLSHLTHQAGFSHYEISNYAKKEKKSAHNLVYWENRPYLGLGLSATSRLGPYRKKHTCQMTDYLNLGPGDAGFYEEVEIIDAFKEMQESLILGLRLKVGLSLEDFYTRYGQSIEDVFFEEVASLKEAGLIHIDRQKESIYLSKKGQRYSNQALAVFV